ncbi:hypothetical protein N7517_000310 [Penicillium concentricum]|uniref:Uncharacterized protein n=1 Tax=Penicillium concentricum TaxID=293559 RepID=A0A9W9SRX1_9EURO|nr:uncharacterized protein N7517_000310 [Penicillium concentricum]KAJ5382399.1 hypothetical protein N7517_000310 [Penicillium concentricum]
MTSSYSGSLSDIIGFPEIKYHEAQEFESVEFEFDILTNSNDEPPGQPVAEPATLPNECQIPQILYFLTDISEGRQSLMLGLLDQRVIV